MTTRENRTNGESEMNESELFHAALKLSAEVRPSFLEAACAGNKPMRDAVESLINAHFASGGPLDDERLSGTTSTNPDALVNALSGTVIAERYKLLEQIGEGGMGTVWLAEQLAPIRRKVAVKLVKAGVNSKSALARFDAERQALAIMDHPNIARIFDGGITPQGQPYFVMEYVKGTSLTEYCDSARLSLHDRLQLFLAVCQAVQHAHQKGIIHRDLKPSNILACLYDGRPVPKVIDFGLAKALHQPLSEMTLFTAHGTMMGTPLYMSPEQTQQNNLDVDTRSDIYSLGVILYELLTGTTPLEKHQLQTAALHEVVRFIKEVEPPKPSTRLSSSDSLPGIAAQRSIDPDKLRRSVKGDLDWIVMKTLEKERARRYETVGSLAGDIERFLHGEAVEACPPSWTYRSKKFARKHRVGLLLTGAVATLLVASTVVTRVQYLRASRAAVAEKIAAQAAEGSRKEALTAQTAALSQLETTRSVLGFLSQDLLAQAVAASAVQGGYKPDPDIRLRTAIDRAAEKIPDRFAGKPESEMLVRTAIGDAYSGLGILPAALEQLRQAWNLAQHDPEHDHDAYFHTASSLSLVLIRLQKYSEARNILEQALATMKGWTGKDAEIAVAFDGMLKMVNEMNTQLVANASGADKSNDSNSSTGERFQRLMEAMPDDKSRAIASKSFSGMFKAMDLASSGQAQEADAQMEKVLEQVAGGEQPGMGDLMQGILAADAGKLDEALKLVRNAQNQIKKQLGNDDPSAGLASFMVSAVLVQQKNFAEAESHLRESIRIHALTQSPMIPIQDCKTLLGRVLVAQNKFDEARTTLFEAIGYDQSPAQNSLPKMNSTDPMEIAADPLTAIVDLYRAEGNSELADKWEAARKK